MSTFDEMMERIESRREQERASDKAIAALSGMTIDEFDADTTVPDPIQPPAQWEEVIELIGDLCPSCLATTIGQYEIVCDDCLDKANLFRTNGKPRDWR